MNDVAGEAATSIIIPLTDVSEIKNNDRVFLSLKKAMLDVRFSFNSVAPFFSEQMLRYFKVDALKTSNAEPKRPKAHRLILGDGTAKLLVEDFILEVRFSFRATSDLASYGFC